MWTEPYFSRRYSFLASGPLHRAGCLGTTLPGCGEARGPATRGGPRRWGCFLGDRAQRGREVMGGPGRPGVTGTG